ncbi:hypothetical protein CPAR01_12315 [Colletotrichum paranaense]|uniref:Uncharacterized protein n=5 Tax=Colletotrichum acutatum species complex TaxID=2707335 RepID=A0A9Q8T446_9PEZI|nr:uncharacterized protein CLUP02_14491 [Colletotrichum lupini]XP_060304416.1 uncharacterized protein CCOS01_16916 [Colletotrichum costaricense]XP_060345357.1 uncharacterized protein CPAR01_12315 [Colletotrichum paranaense]XP_060395503.1 uncharacterized protein CABS01_12762 [Colletotrichum abscissum]KAI3529725.1 hypothetical protein CSPX01_15295 [Colletotrichum filicis]KAK1454488.1 hypothetical protein CMEL01_16720 [Colletotrichum melonis]KAK1494866.1 hypothetical protein CCUS01_13560 [Collet
MSPSIAPVQSSPVQSSSVQSSPGNWLPLRKDTWRGEREGTREKRRGDWTCRGGEVRRGEAKRAQPGSCERSEWALSLRMP